MSTLTGSPKTGAPIFKISGFLCGNKTVGVALVVEAAAAVAVEVRPPDALFSLGLIVLFRRAAGL